MNASYDGEDEFNEYEIIDKNLIEKELKEIESKEFKNKEIKSTSSETTLDLLLWITNDSKKRRFMELITGESWTHVGIVLEGKDIIKMHSSISLNYSNINPNLLYIWESGYNGIKDVEDDKIKFGVMITPWKKKMKQLNESGGRCVLRKFNRPIDSNILNSLEIAHNETYLKSYDINPLHFLEAFFGKNFGMNGQYDNAFFCSAFVAYIYTKIGCLDSNTQWTTIQPKFFASSQVDHFLNPIDSNTISRPSFWDLNLF